MADLVKFEELDQNAFFECRKTATTRARVLTINDFEAMTGAINTLEGPVQFVPGDYLCVGAVGEMWPITKEKFENTKFRVSELDPEGWADYKNTNVVRAIQIDTDFKVKLSNGSIVEGKARGYLIDGGASQWLCDEIIFNDTYERV